MRQSISRRRALKLGAATSALPLVHIRSAAAAGKLSLALWDHWVPEGNTAMRRLVNIWADKNKVEVQLDFLTAIGNKINITMAAEAAARTGHDVYAFDMWTVHEFAEALDPVDDVVKGLTDKYGKIAGAVEYLGKANGHWMAVPVGWGSAPLATCARISMLKKFAGIDVTQWYPAHESTPQAAADWTYDTQLRAAEACKKAGFPFGLGCGATTDSNQTWGATFGAFGAHLINAKDDIIVDSDNVRMALEYAKKMLPNLPEDTVSYDDASNNRALISGKSALIWNPPSAWAVAKRDAPAIAEDCWTFPNPRGPKGRLVPYRPYFWGVWQFAQNKSAAKDLITFLSQREQVEVLAQAVIGYDIPPFLSMSDLKIWSEVGPPTGTVYNYPIRPWHDAEYYVTGSSGPPEIAVQMWNRGTVPTMVAKLFAGLSIDQTIAWAKDELEGFKR
jgi:hypothetical protein